MALDKRQFALNAELNERRDWYWLIKEKTFKQLNFAPKSVKPLMLELMQYLEQTAIPTVNRLIETLGFWSNTDAWDFYNANVEVCRLTEQINAAATEEDRQTFQNQSWNLL